jgi:hypothetical protein
MGAKGYGHVDMLNGVMMLLIWMKGTNVKQTPMGQPANMKIDCSKLLAPHPIPLPKGAREYM